MNCYFSDQFSSIPSSQSVDFEDSENKNSHTNPLAPLSSSLFMIIRELPSLLSTAYSLRYKDIKIENGIFNQIQGKIRRYIQLIQEIFTEPFNQDIKNKNLEALDTDFKKLDEELKTTERPICVYFVSNSDHNGAILANRLYYYHHYKINKFKKHYDVSAKVMKSAEDVINHLKKIKEDYPNRPIKVVDIVSHGSKSNLWLGWELFGKRAKTKNLFEACASDAAIILDACSTGEGQDSIAKLIAKHNPGKNVFGAQGPLFFSKPVFSKKGDTTTLDYVTHGFAIFNAYTCRKFQTAL